MPADYAPSSPLRSDSLAGHMRGTLRLAVPVMVARAGALVLVAVDTAMTGHAGPAELAYYGLAIAPQVPLFLVGIGLMMGTGVLTAQAEAAGEPAECGVIWRVALIHAALVGGVLVLLCQLGEPFLRATGQSPANAAGGGGVLAVFGWGMPAALFYIATVFFLEALHRPLPGMLAMLGANILNAGLNWVFIYGHWGAPAMGAEGAALATTVVRWLMFGAVAVYVLRRLHPATYGVTGPMPDWAGVGRRLRRIGYPLALSHGMEAGAFSTLILFAGLLGARQVAAYMVAMNVVSLVFMGSIGLANAASVRVANAVGRGDAADVRRAGWVALAVALAFLSTVALAVRAAPELIAAVYTDDPAVAALAVCTLGVAALVLIPDGAQAVLMGALRGTGRLWAATLRFVVAFWLVMVPLGYVTGVRWDGGAPALMRAVMVGCIAAALLLGARFHTVSREAVGRT